MHNNLHFITKSEDSRAFHTDLCFDVSTTDRTIETFIVIVALLFYVYGKHLRSCRDGQLT